MPDEIATPEKPETARSFRRSDSLTAFLPAFIKAQRMMKAAIKEKENSHFHSKYADLSSVRDACQEPLNASGIAVMQFARTGENGVEVETVLFHESGEFIAETLAIPVYKADAHGVGSAITYARRYGLSAITGIAPEEDDGNAAAKSVEDLRQKGLAILTPAARQGLAKLDLAWKTLSEVMRRVCKADMDKLKEDAAKADKATKREGVASAAN